MKTNERYAALPGELKQSSRWVNYKIEEVEGQTKKVPYGAKTKQRADITNPDDWASFDDAIATDPEHVGLVIGSPFIGLDLDDCLDPDTAALEQWAGEIIDSLPDTYTELSPSGTGLHLWFRCDDHRKLKDGKRTKIAEVYAKNRYFTVTGKRYMDAPSTLANLSLAQAQGLYDWIDSLREKSPGTERVNSYGDKSIEEVIQQDPKEFPDLSAAVRSLLCRLAHSTKCDEETMEVEFKKSKLYRETHWREKWERLRESELEGACALVRATIQQRRSKGHSMAYVGDGSDWREGCKSRDQLTSELPRFLLGGLIPEKALTFITGPSYHGKTWLVLQAARAISQGQPLWGFDGPTEPVPVLYHVPEMNEAFVRQRMDLLGIPDGELFLTRTMEAGLWPLNDPRMIESAKGRMVILDTAGYFNPTDDANDYKQALNFGELVANLLAQGARAVVGIYHSPKYARNDTEMTLENMLMGSAGYGGILRSCLGVRNLNPDLNDSNVHLYVQGLKNPGLKPFQLEGVPLGLKVPPGESPYLATLLAEQRGQIDPRYAKACQMFAQGKSQKDIIEALRQSGQGVNFSKIGDWKQRWEKEKSGSTRQPPISFDNVNATDAT